MNDKIPELYDIDTYHEDAIIDELKEEQHKSLNIKLMK
jgi:hypothetical protein